MNFIFNSLSNIFKFFEIVLKKIYKTIRILIFFAFTFVFIIFGGFILYFIYKILIARLIQNKETTVANKFFYDCVIFFVKSFLDTFVEVKIWGKKNVPETGAKLFVSNHFSSTDVLFMSSFIKDRTHMVLGPIYDIPVLKNLLRILEQIDASYNNRKNVITDAVRYINKKESVYIFPEGDLNDQQNFLNFYNGAAKIYIESNGIAPIIPIGIVAAKKDVKEFKLFNMKAKEIKNKTYKSLNVLSGRYLINIGEPLEFKDLLNSDKTYDEKCNQITIFIKNYIKELVDEAKFDKFWN